MKRFPILLFLLLVPLLGACATAERYALGGAAIGAAAGAGGGALLAGPPGAKIGAVVGAGTGAYVGYQRGLAVEREQAALAHQQALARGITECRYPFDRMWDGGKLLMDRRREHCVGTTVRSGYPGDETMVGPPPAVLYEPGVVKQEPYSKAVPTVPSAAATIPTVPPSATAPPPPSTMVQPQYAPYYGPLAIPGQQGSWWQKHHRGSFGGFYRGWGM